MDFFQANSLLFFAKLPILLTASMWPSTVEKSGGNGAADNPFYLKATICSWVSKARIQALCGSHSFRAVISQFSPLGLLCALMKACWASHEFSKLNWALLAQNGGASVVIGFLFVWFFLILKEVVFCSTRVLKFLLRHCFRATNQVSKTKSQRYLPMRTIFTKVLSLLVVFVFSASAFSAVTIDFEGLGAERDQLTTLVVMDPDTG